MTIKAAFPAAALLLLSACGGQAETKADRLEEAAEQSDPAAAPILENAAEAVREGEGNAQQALARAGNAQAQTLPGAQEAPPSMQAKPNRTGQQTPPPKIPTGPGAEPKHEGNSH